MNLNILNLDLYIPHCGDIPEQDIYLKDRRDACLGCQRSTVWMKCSTWQLGDSLTLQWKKVHTAPKFTEKMFMNHSVVL